MTVEQSLVFGDRLQHLLAMAAIEFVRPVGHQFCHHLEFSERGAQLVSGVRAEAPFPLEPCFESLEHFIELVGDGLQFPRESDRRKPCVQTCRLYVAQFTTEVLERL